MNKGFLRLGAAMGVSTILASSAAFGQTVDLRPRFEKGEELRYRMNVKSSGDTKLPGAEQAAELKQAMDQTIGLKLKTIATDPEGNSTVEMVYESIKLSMSSSGEKTSFDSAQPKEKDGDDPLAKGLRSLVGTTLTLKMDRDGNITEVSGGEALGAAAMGGAGGLTSPQGIKQMWGPVFTTRRSTGQAKVGETWKTEDALDVGLLGKFTMTTESKLKRASGGTAEIDFTGKIAPGPGSSGIGMQIKDSSYGGTYLWDTRKGCLEKMNSDQKIAIEGDIGGTKMSTKSQTKVEVSRVK